MYSAQTQSAESSSDAVVTLDEWPLQRSVYLTLDLECDYGTAARSRSFHAARRIETLVDLLSEWDVPLTCFLQTEILDAAPRAVESLEDAAIPVEFHAHSHTHPRRMHADVRREVAASVQRVRDRFGTDPIGYRFPDGAKVERDFEILEANDVAFDASLFPSWRPGRFDNTDAPIYPFRHDRTDVIELPFTVYSDRIRIPVALSYLKLLGRPFQRFVTRSPPSVVVFDMHMHDVSIPPTHEDLPLPYRLVYSRRKNDGYEILETFVKALQDQGYRFGRLSELYTATEAEIDA